MLLLAVLAAGPVLARSIATGCATDADCPWGDGAWRCCGTGDKAENCAAPPKPPAPGSHCVLPGDIGATTCSCQAPPSCGSSNYPAAEPGMKQMLVIGDSISYGMLGPATAIGKNHSVQVVHNPTNAANVWWGSHCVDGWLSANPGRWDIVTYQFGLHDLALDNERVEPNNVYAEYLGNVTRQLLSKLPNAKLAWVTTTPVPKGIGGYCNKSTGQGGCPPRLATDPPIYNSAAAGAVASAGAGRITTIDLYAHVTQKCGIAYDRCPEGCTATKVGAKWTGDCYQIPLNVHYLQAGFADLAAHYMAEALAM